MNIDEEWNNFISLSNEETYTVDDTDKNNNEYILEDVLNDLNGEIPKVTDIYISTTTKIAFLNSSIELAEIFWAIPLLTYYEQKCGVIKKEMKFNTTESHELDLIKEKLYKLKDTMYKEHIITNINNPTGRIKFKDVRKISIGICKKDILECRTNNKRKNKSAFYNCVVLIIRLKIEDKFKEFHVKIFNTGKLEIPGIQDETTFVKVLEQVIDVLQPNVHNKLAYKPNSSETVLINSNFNCGYYIDRDKLHNILKFKYNIQTIYDPCSYPGIQCKFYYNPNDKEQTGCQQSEKNKINGENLQDVSFMIFRTGSILISGKCDKNIIMIIYEFLKKILIIEYNNIHHESNITENITKDKMNKQSRTKTIKINIDQNE